MKKVLIALYILAASTVTYAACSTSTTSYNGKYVTCTTCCFNGGNCNTNCF